MEAYNFNFATYDAAMREVENILAANPTQADLDRAAEIMLRADAKVLDANGKPKGIRGDNPILFEEHLYARRRREIHNENGVPDPSIAQGMYFRTHPQGRKVNSEESRKRHGSSYYR